MNLVKKKVFFYPKEFYIFDNFSSFQVEWDGHVFSTAEHAYQAKKFIKTNPDLFEKIKNAKSAHDAQRIAMENKDFVDLDWDKNKKSIMKDILRNKINKHPYVLKNYFKQVKEI